MTAAVALLFLSVATIIIATALNQQIINEKMQAAVQARVIALNSAEAGLIAEEARINDENVNLTDIKGQLNYYISSDIVDNCQQRTVTIISAAVYGSARIKLTEAYLKAPPEPITGCLHSNSHRLWWREID